MCWRLQVQWNGYAETVVGIDGCVPWTELSMNVKNNMKGHLEPLKFLFQINDSHPASNRTYFDCAVTKFGIHRAFKVMEEYMPPDDRVCVRIPICTPS